MTITLIGQEALDYLELLKQPQHIPAPIEDISVQHLNDIADDIQFAEPKPLQRAAFHKPHSYPDGVIRESVLRPRWTIHELGVLNFRIDPLSKAAPSERKLINAIAKIPDRTEAAIRSKIIELNGYVASGTICKA